MKPCWLCKQPTRNTMPWGSKGTVIICTDCKRRTDADISKPRRSDKR